MLFGVNALIEFLFPLTLFCCQAATMSPSFLLMPQSRTTISSKITLFFESQQVN